MRKQALAARMLRELPGHIRNQKRIDKKKLNYRQILEHYNIPDPRSFLVQESNSFEKM